MQAELHLPHGGRGVSNLASPRFVDRGGRQPKVRMIESVEVLPTELERLPLSNDELLRQRQIEQVLDRKSTRLNSSHVEISYAVFCLKKKTPDGRWCCPKMCRR